MLGSREARRRLIRSLRVLASPYEVQLKALPAYVALGDELIDVFFTALEQADEAVGTSPRWQREREALGPVEAAANRINDSADEAVWDPQAIESDPQWEELRQAAASALQLFGKDADEPPELDWLTFVPAG